MSQSSSPQPVTPTTLQLSKRGDVLLKLGAHGETRLLVSTAHMSEASSVFAAMFDGRFLEGQSSTTDAQREVLLPDDDPESMTILCKIVHFQADDVLESVTLDALADFAILCDKYDCIRAAAPWGKLWVNEFLAVPITPSTEKLILVTYLLDLPWQFRQTTKLLVQHRTAIDESVARHGLDFLPKKLFGT